VVTRGQEGRTGGRPPRRSSWNKSLSDSFGPIKQVGVSISIGVPLLVVGILFVTILVVTLVGVEAGLWLLAAAVLVTGLAAAISGRVL
jgi:hypothetical protein